MLQLHAVTTTSVTDPSVAREIISRLHDAPLAMDRYAGSEPIRSPLDGCLDEAAAMLVGSGKSGGVMLAGTRPKRWISLAWTAHPSGAQWHGQLPPELAKPARVDALLAALEDVFSLAPARYAALLPEAAWHARHFERQVFPDGSETVTKVGLDLAAQLPGIYWWTLLGPEAIAYFGRERVLALPCARVRDLGRAGVSLLADATPMTGEDGTPSAAEAAIRDALEPSHFFDISARKPARVGIDGVTLGERR